MKTTIYDIDKITKEDNILHASYIAKRVIEEYHFIAKRKIEALLLAEQERLSIKIETHPMGSGGVGTVKIMKDRTVRIQIGYGTGRYNYAPCIVVK